MLRRNLTLILITALFIACFIACAGNYVAKGEKEPQVSQLDVKPFTSFRDIPGVTAEDIEAAELLIAGRDSFIFGVMPSTEAFYGENNEIHGFTAMFCGWLTEMFGIPFIPQLYEWGDLITGLQSREIDFTTELTATEERKKIFSMTDGIIERMMAYFRISGSVPLPIIAESRELRYGFLAGTITSDLIAADVDYTFETVWVDDYDEAYAALKSGEIDAFFELSTAEAAFDIYGDVDAEILLPPLYNTSSLMSMNTENTPIINIIQRAVENEAFGYLAELYNLGVHEYYKHKLTMQLTEHESAYISNNPVVSFLAEHDNYPISFYNSHDNEFQGIAHDVIREIEALTGLRFDIKNDPQANAADLLSMLESGGPAGAPMITELIRTPEREERFLWAETAVLTDSLALLSTLEQPNIKINGILNTKIGLVEGYSQTETFRRWFSTHANTVVYDDYDAAFSGLTNGEVNMVMGSLNQLLVQTNFREQPGFKANLVFDYSYESTFGFNRNEAVLRSIIDKALNLTDTESISNQWMYKTFDYRAKIAEARVPLLVGIFISVALIFALIVVLVLFMFFKSRRAALIDISEAKTEQEKLELMLNTSPTSIVLFNSTLQIIDCNESTLVLLGLTDKQEYKNRFYTDCSPEYQPNGQRSGEKAASLLREAFETGHCFFEWILKKPDDGSLIPTEVTLVRTKFDDDDVVICYTTDMREYKEQLAIIEKMRDADERMRTLLAVNPQINFLFDSKFKLIDCNPAAMAFMGFKTKEETLNGFAERLAKSIPEIQPDGRPSVPLAGWIAKTVEEEQVRFETELNMQGIKRVLDVNMKKIPYEDSFAIVGFIHELTEMKNLIHEAEKQRMEAETANKTKSVFLSHVSHEIRTPMNAILGTAEIQLQKEDTLPEIEEAFGIIYNSGNLLLNIINDILDLSKIEAGKLEIISDKYDIPSIIYDTVQLVLLRYNSKPIEFVLKIDENTPLDLLGDELRIKQVINNILSNAFKYTDKGTVELSVSAENIVDSKCTIIFSVTDTGQGMTEEQISRLFDEYTRFNMDSNRTIVGTGLGMHITKRLLEAMNGEILVNSEPGKGSMFTVRLVQERIGNNICGTELAQQLRTSRFKSVLKSNRAHIIREYMPYGSVLIVDDVESNLYVARGMMQPYGLKIETVSSGIEAVDKIKEGNNYDIIFMDHMMPVMNGMDSTKIIRDLGYTNPVVALTANAVAGISAMFLENGFDGFMSKPIDIRELNSLLNRLIRDKQPPDVIEAARKLVMRKKIVSDNGSKNKNDFSKIVVEDIKRALAVLEEILPELNHNNDADLSLFTTTVHGLKSALLNIEEAEVSAVALKLEKAGNAGEITEISERTPEFMNELRKLLEKHKPEETSNSDASSDISDEYRAFLTEKLEEIKTACENLNVKAAKKALADLKQITWPHMIDDIFDKISIALLCGEYEKVAAAVESFIMHK